MDFQEYLYNALINRQSIRAFQEKPVDPEIVDKIIQAASRAPSAKNTQPWRLVHIGKKTMDKITPRLKEAFDAGEPARPDMEIAVYDGILRKNAVELGKKFYEHLNINRKDQQQKIELVYQNYHFWNAPNAFYLYSIAGIKENEIFDIGIFTGFLFAMMEAYGIGSIAQASLVDYPDIVKEELGLDLDTRLITGISFGYPDNRHSINEFRTTRFENNFIVKNMD